MQLGTWKKIIGGAFGAVLIGAVGSGVWDIALKPGGQWLVNACLTAVTLGSARLKDQVYVEAARGFHEASGLDSSAALTLFKVWIFWLLVMTVWILVRTFDLLTRERSQGPDPIAAEKDRRDMVRLNKFGRMFAVAVSIFSLIAIGVETGKLMKRTAANNACTYFKQAETICRPYMTDRQTQLLESRFAAVRSKSDYIAIVNDLKSVAAANRLWLPDFKPW